MGFNFNNIDCLIRNTKNIQFWILFYPFLHYFIMYRRIKRNIWQK